MRVNEEMMDSPEIWLARWHALACRLWRAGAEGSAARAKTQAMLEEIDRLERALGVTGCVDGGKARRCGCSTVGAMRRTSRWDS